MKNLNPTDIEITPFFELTPDLVCVATKDGYFAKVNKAVLDVLEYSQQEIFSRPISSFIHPEDQELTRQEREKLLNGEALLNFQNRYLSKTGKVVWLHWTSIYFAEQEVVFAIAKDVTERKMAEAEIEERYRKFKGLATHFKHSLEKDRKLLATELHEEIAQLATVIKMDMDWLMENAPDSNAMFLGRMAHAAAVADKMIKSIRKISFSISTGMIDDLGLCDALKTLCRDFTLLSGIPCKFDSSFTETSLTNELKMDLFRICQDALRHMMHQEGVEAVHIGIKNAKDEVYLSVHGKGLAFIDPTTISTLEIKAIKQRAASINSRVLITPIPGEGTTLEVKITL